MSKIHEPKARAGAATTPSKDPRKLEKTSVPGIYRRHASSCNRNGRCRCSYVVRWKDGGRTRKQLFTTFELAREHKGGLDSGKTTRRPLSSKTLSAYYKNWLANYRGRTARGVEDSTRRGYEISFRLHILPLLIARIRLRDLDAPDIREWMVQLEQRGASPSTIRRARIALSVMLACAREDGDIASNPASGVRYVPSEKAKQRHPKRRPRRLTAEDIVAILRAMPEQWRAFFTLLAQTGLRIGELLGLTWEHVHLGDDPHIMVAEQVYQGRRKQLKTDASEARVPLSASMASWLAELRPANARPAAPVFPSRTGTPLTYSNVYNRVLRPALLAAGLATKVGEDDERQADLRLPGDRLPRFPQGMRVAAARARKDAQAGARLAAPLAAHHHDERLHPPSRRRTRRRRRMGRHPADAWGHPAPACATRGLIR